MKATQTEKEVIKRLAWYSTEFGLVMEDNRFKVFGAGIISGRAELANTIMEFYRLNRDNVIDYSGDVFAQLQEHFNKHKEDLKRIIAGVNELHQKGEMSSQDQGWNVVHGLYKKLGISRKGYFGGEVILAPFDVEMIAQIPKTVYAFNPMFFVCESFEQMDALLDSYLKPIAERNR
jgi:phenylalanine-4-hydroxylase